MFFWFMYATPKCSGMERKILAGRLVLDLLSEKEKVHVKYLFVRRSIRIFLQYKVPNRRSLGN
jgi:hypothetical protein